MEHKRRMVEDDLLVNYKDSLKCVVCKRMLRNPSKNKYNICSKCLNRTLGTLIRSKVISEKIFSKEAKE